MIRAVIEISITALIGFLDMPVFRHSFIEVAWGLLE